MVNFISPYDNLTIATGEHDEKCQVEVVKITKINYNSNKNIRMHKNRL